MTAASPPALLEARGLARHYAVSRGLFRGKAVVRALDGVSFTLGAGRTLAVVGESGCGKSTLARQVTMIEIPTAGSLLLDGDDVAHADAAARKRLRPRVQMVFQNPYASLNPRKTVGALLEEPLAIRGEPAAARREAALAMLARVGLRPEQYGRFPHMFSGGQRQRIAVARALMLHPRLVVLDEPVSALDVSIQAQVLNLFMDLKSALNLTYLFISHDLGVVEHISDRVVIMYLGRVVESGPTSDLYASPNHPYTQALLKEVGKVLPGKRTFVPIKGEIPSPLAPPPGCHFHPRCPYAMPRCRTEPPALKEIAPARLSACHLNDTSPNDPSA